MGPEFFMHITFPAHCLKQPGQALIINKKTFELYESFRRKAENGTCSFFIAEKGRGELI